MKNKSVRSILDATQVELGDIQQLIHLLGVMNNANPYLTRYSIIRACGTLEFAFKALIADSCTKGGRLQTRTFVNTKVRDSSTNPRFGEICRILGEFDENWKKNFKDKVKRIPNSQQCLDSLNSLVEARNQFAHGGTPNMTIDQVVTFYTESRKLIEIIDNVVK